MLLLSTFASKRTLTQQALGIFSFFSLSLLVLLSLGWISHYSYGLGKISQLPSIMSFEARAEIWGYYFSLLPLSLWMLWRQYPLNSLKLEITLYISHLGLLLFWAHIISQTDQYFLAFINMVFLFSMLIIMELLFWKKNMLISGLLLPNLLWLGYLIVMDLEAYALFT